MVAAAACFHKVKCTKKMASQSIISVCLYGVCGIRVSPDILTSTKVCIYIPRIEVHRLKY